MALNRREFLGALLATGVSAHAQPRGENPDSWLFREDRKRGFSILQGMTDENSSQFSLVLPKAGAWKVEVVPKDGMAAAIEYSEELISRPYSDFAVYKVAVSGLELGREYLLRVSDGRGTLQDERDFTALDLSLRRVRLAFVSCALDLLHRDDIWRQFEVQNPEVALFLGDNVYADRTSFINKRPADEKQLWERYVLTRNRVLMYFQRRLRPVLATWDDHDYGADNAGREFEHKEAARFTFETFFAQQDRPSLAGGPGVSKRWSAFGADLVLLDGRTFRDEPGRAGSKLLGSEQEEWLLEGVRGVPTWLMSGSQFYGGYTGRDSYEGPFSADFKELIAKLSVTPGLYCFASGDVHFSEVMDIEPAQLGYSTFELVSSSIHSYTFPGHENRFRNRRRRAATSAHNFVIFEGRFDGGRIQGELVSYSATRAEFRATVLVER